MIHSAIQQAFTEFLLCAKHWAQFKYEMDYSVVLSKAHEEILKCFSAEELTAVEV